MFAMQQYWLYILTYAIPKVSRRQLAKSMSNRHCRNVHRKLSQHYQHDSSVPIGNRLLPPFAIYVSLSSRQFTRSVKQNFPRTICSAKTQGKFNPQISQDKYQQNVFIDISIDRQSINLGILFKGPCSDIHGSRRNNYKRQ